MGVNSELLSMKAQEKSETELPLCYVGVGDKYRIKELIGEGSFGQVYRVVDTRNHLANFAVKIQDEEAGKSRLTMSNEFKMYTLLLRDKNIGRERSYIPKLFYYAQEEHFNVMIMQLLGPTLKTILQEKTSFKMRTVLLLVDQMISAVEFIHRKGIIHRDLKPANFCIGIGKKENQVFLIDFGLGKRYINHGEHIDRAMNTGMIGNKMYGSLCSHQHYQQSRRDDMESLGYIFVEFAKGTLPWKKCCPDLSLKQRRDLPLTLKQTLSVAQICKGLPEVFCRYLQHIKQLKFTQEPNYEYYRAIFRKQFTCQNYSQSSKLFE